MTTADLFNPKPVLQIQELKGLLDDLSKHHATPAESGLLHGEVVALFNGGLTVQLRDPRGSMVELRLDQALEAERGDSVEVQGAPEIVTQTNPLGLRMVWRGTAVKPLGVAKRFAERRALAEKLAADLPFETPRINERLRGGGRFRVVTERHSKASEAVAEASLQYRWLKPDVRYYDEVRKPGSLARVLEALHGVICKGDVVLIARDAGQVAELDLFEETRVLEPLAKLTKRCATILAVGHAGDALLTNQVVTHPVETAGVALQLVLRESGARAIEAPVGVAAGPEAESDLVSTSSTIAPPGKRRGPWARWLLVGAATYLGWWARGSQTGEPEAAQQQPPVVSSLTGTSSAR